MAVALRKELGPKGRAVLVLGLLGAPMMLIDGILLVYVWKTKTPNSPLDGLLSLVYMAAWLAIAVRMARQRIFGKGVGGAILHGIQVVGLVLGGVWSVLQMLGLERMGLLGTITDIAWPASHIFSLVLGVAAWRVRVWKGWRRAPLFVQGAALPVSFALAPSLGGPSWAAFGLLTGAGIASMALAVASSETES